MSDKQSSRLLYLDGLRGVAIMSVVLFHAYVRWVDIVPYGDKFAAFPLFKFGNYGVFLFFLISGYVILMTLEKCDTYWLFLKKRWLRLFPAMLTASAIIFSTARIFFERPAGIPILRDVLPGLIFVPPLFLEKLLGSQQGLLEGVFWTIFVEVAFYLIFGFLYYRLKERAIYALALISVLGIIIKVAATQGLLSNLAQLSAAIGLQFFSWFTTGALVYQYRKEATRNNLVLLCISIFITCLSMVSRSSQIGMAVSFLVILLFLAPPYLSWLERALTLRPLLLLGFISYPLYLLHENLLISMILKLVAFAPFVPLVLSPVLPILALVLLAYLVAKYIEPGLRARLAAYL